MIHAGAQRFADTADEFRKLVEQPPASTNELARRLTFVLGRLVAAGCELPEPFLVDGIDWKPADDIPSEEFEISDDAELNVFDAILARLGPCEYREYLEPFDLAGDGHPATPMLAYQVSTIYGDLLPGLRAWRTDTYAGRCHAILSWTTRLVVWHRSASSALVALHHILVDRNAFNP